MSDRPQIEESEGAFFPRWLAVGVLVAMAAITAMLFARRAQQRKERARELISVSPDSWTETSPTAAILGDGDAAAAWLAYARGARDAESVTVRVLSAASGAWSEPVSVRVPGRAARSPELVADPAGGVWLVFVGTRAGENGAAADARVFVAHGVETPPASDGAWGGLVFDPPRELPRGEGLSLSGAPRAAAIGARLFVASREERAGYGRIALVEAGAGAEPVAVIEADGFTGASPSPCASDGRVYVAWVDYPSGVVVREMDETGAFGPQREGNASKIGEELASDAPSCFARGDDVTVMYGIAAKALNERSATPLLGVHLARSTDAARTFPARTEVHDAGLVMMRAAMIADPSGGARVAYYAASDAVDAAGSLRWTRVGSVGEPAAPQVVVRAPIFLASRWDDPRGLGESLGLAAGAGRVGAAFVDNAEGSAHVAWAELER